MGLPREAWIGSGQLERDLGQDGMAVKATGLGEATYEGVSIDMRRGLRNKVGVHQFLGARMRRHQEMQRESSLRGRRRTKMGRGSGGQASTGTPRAGGQALCATEGPWLHTRGGSGRKPSGWKG